MTRDPSTPEALARRIAVARGEAPGDLLLMGGRYVNVFTRTVETGDVVIADGWIAGVGEFSWTAAQTVDLAGGVVTPGLIDAHMHVESTLLTPPQFARLVVPRGTAAVIADPHEIGNVLGPRGVELMLAASEGLPLDVFYMAPSCVPASPFENAGATMDAEAIERLLAYERVLGLAEMMNFPGVLTGAPDVTAKIAAVLRAGGAVGGHCPGLIDRELIAYAAAGIRSDHECTTPEEARQRAALGMLVQIREGSMARNLDALLPLAIAGELPRWCFCTDDIHPEDLVRDGHIDHLLRRSVARGLPAADAVTHATWVPAQHYGLRDRGAVAPGYRADLAVFADLESFEATYVLFGGTPVARDGMTLGDDDVRAIPTGNTVQVGPLEPSGFELPLPAGRARVIRAFPDQIVTGVEVRDVPTEEGRWVFRADEDLALVACIQRHEPTGAMGVGLVAGFGFGRHGAIGSSVGHDAHNLMVAGTNAGDMIACARVIEEMGGGFAVVADGAVTARMALPVAGLMSTEPAETVCAQQREVNAAAAELGCGLPAPFGTLSFLPLSVIPALRITDDGLFDVNAFELVPVAVEA
jgi:adenine deaminase